MQTQEMQETKTGLRNDLSNKDTESTVVETRRVVPPMDIYESDNEFLLNFDVPGVIETDVHLEIEKGVLSLTATRMLTDTSAVEYRRDLSVGESIDAGRIEAKLERGVLAVHLAKREELRPRRIEVRSA